MANNGYTAAVATSIPLKLMDDPFLLRDAETLKYYGEKIGKAALFAAFVFDLYNGIKTGIKTNSFWRGLIKPLLELYLLVWDILLLEQRHFL